MTDLNISHLTFGTMRLFEKGLSESECCDLFLEAIDGGITTFHVSEEYASFELVSRVFNLLPQSEKNKIRLIAKLAAPHFDEDDFDYKSLENRVDSVIGRLGVDDIEVGQWMWRQSPIDDDSRLSMLSLKSIEISESFDRLKRKGKLVEVGCFPYTAEFMNKVRELGISDIHINYLNFWETALLDGGVGNNAISLRPLGAGRIKKLDKSELNEIVQSDDISTAQHALLYSMSHPCIKSVVLGINNSIQLQDALGCLSIARSDLNLFNCYNDFVLKTLP